MRKLKQTIPNPKALSGNFVSSAIVRFWPISDHPLISLERTFNAHHATGQNATHSGHTLILKPKAKSQFVDNIANNTKGSRY